MKTRPVTSARITSVGELPEIWAGEHSPEWFEMAPAEYRIDVSGHKKWADVPEAKRIELQDKYWKKWHPRTSGGGFKGAGFERLGPHYVLRDKAVYMDGEFEIEQSYPGNTVEKFRES